jgi:hypothetical protein
VEPSSSTPPTVTTTVESPGLVVRGFVRLEDGTGLPNVRIDRAFAGYIGDVVATTNAEGYFESAFQFIPGDEMVRVWAQAEGYAFGPDGVNGTLWEDGQYAWRHYYGREVRDLGFIAIPAASPSPTATLPPPATATITPTSQPGPAVLLQPDDGATLPQPVAPGEWVFTWTGRTGPCSSLIRIDGPGGRQIGYTVVSAQGGQYSYRYSAAEPLPDDALWPWNWSVDIVCPAGTSRSDPRTFRVVSAGPTPTPGIP